jgi:DNA modification methylase
MTLPINEVVHGDCLEVLKSLPDNSVSCVVSDPPYGLGQHEPTPQEVLEYLGGAELKTGDFMNKPWDLPPVAVWRECFRVLKPGGHLLAFAGTRTQDLMSMGIRMAGFENRDTIAAFFGPNSTTMSWVYGSGFPKSRRVSLDIDRKLGYVREIVGSKNGVGGENLNDIVNGREIRQTTDDGGKGVGAYGTGAKQMSIVIPVTADASEEAKRWSGWGTNLKPANEPILCFRKPIVEKTLAEQVLSTGTGVINIDATRIGASGGLTKPTISSGDLRDRWDGNQALGPENWRGNGGRWPANVLLVHTDGCQVVGTKKVKAPVINRFDSGMKPFGDGAGHSFTSTQTGDENGQEDVPLYECVEGCPAKALDEQSGELQNGGHLRASATQKIDNDIYGSGFTRVQDTNFAGDKGGASRFFAQFEPDAPFIYCAKASPSEKKLDTELEQHPTVKPVSLMSYLVRLVTPKGGIVLDPYLGSGTTAVAAIREGVNFIGIEKYEPYVQRARMRIAKAYADMTTDTSQVKEKASKPTKKEAKPTREQKKEVLDTSASDLLDLALSDDDSP